MRLDHCVFLITQAARLIDDRILDPDLANVMEKTHHEDLILLLLRTAGALRDFPGVGGHAGRMAVRISVLGVHRCGQRLNNLDVDPGQLFGLCPDLIGHIIVQAVQLDDIPHSLEQDLCRKWFPDKISRPGVKPGRF